MLSYYHTVLGEDLFWSTYEDLSIPIHTIVIPRGQFRKLKMSFHTIDLGNLKSGSKMGENYSLIFHTKLSNDESMIPYCRHHSAKIFTTGKPKDLYALDIKSRCLVVTHMQ